MQKYAQRRIENCHESFISLDPLATNGFAHYYHLDEFLVILGTPGVVLNFHSIFQ